MGTAIVFGASLTSLVLFVVFKQWERSRPLPRYRKVLARVDVSTRAAARYVRAVPGKMKFFTVHVVHALAYHAGALMWYVVRFMERKLYKFVNMIKGRREVHRERGSSSLFLNAIAEGKRSSDMEERAPTDTH